MYRPHLVSASTTKNITLPLAGLYHSHTGEGLIANSKDKDGKIGQKNYIRL